jgi:hypothetical protein
MSFNPVKYSKLESLLKIEDVAEEDKNFFDQILYTLRFMRQNYMDVEDIRKNLIKPVKNHRWNDETLKTETYKTIILVCDVTETYLQDLEERMNIVVPRCDKILKNLTGVGLNLKPGICFSSMISDEIARADHKKQKICFHLNTFDYDSKQRNGIISHEIFHLFFNSHLGSKLNEEVSREVQVMLKMREESLELARRMALSVCFTLSSICFTIGKRHNRKDIEDFGHELQAEGRKLYSIFSTKFLFSELLDIYADKLTPQIFMADKLLSEFGIDFLDVYKWQIKIIERMHKDISRVREKDLRVLNSFINEGFAVFFSAIYALNYKESYLIGNYASLIDVTLKTYEENPEVFRCFLNHEEFKKMRAKFIEIIHSEKEWLKEWAKFHGREL